MMKESVSWKQGIVVMITFLMGSSLVLGAGGEAKRDVWIAITLGFLMAIPILFMYARILTNFPGKDLTEIATIALGKALGKVVITLFVWYSFHLGAMVIRNFTEFIKIVSLYETPQGIIALFMIVICIWGVKAGIEVIGRWTAIIFPIMIIAVTIVTLLFIPYLDLDNIKPVLYEGMGPVINNAFSISAFPFAELITFTIIYSKCKTNPSPYKMFFYSALIGGSILMIVSVRSLLSLGVENTSITYFSSYSSARLINIGDFLQRIEVSVAIIFLFGGFVKVCICLYAACYGAAKVLNLKDYRGIVAPVGLLMMILSIILYTNTMEMFEWAGKIYKYYAIPFQIILPLIILISVEMRSFLKRRKKAA